MLSRFLVSLLFCFGCFAQEYSVLEYVQDNLSHRGVLRKSGNFIYVDVDEDYIDELIGLIQEQGFIEPPYFGREDLVGAHISVIYKDEAKQYQIDSIEECGQLIDFVPKECVVVRPPNWKEMEEVYVIVVEAPQLDRIRMKYGLPKSKYPFHITVGVKPKVKKSA